VSLILFSFKFFSSSDVTWDLLEFCEKNKE
jgi:hypothetical protein